MVGMPACATIARAFPDSSQKIGCDKSDLEPGDVVRQQ
jgi:hypothetical protein